MQFNDFKRIVTCFADRVEDVDTSHGELLVQIRDETITARLHQRSSGLLVEEHDARMPAVEWIVKRLARLPLLADRICSYVSPPEHFVPSSGRFLDQLDADPSGEDNLRSDVAEAMTQTLDLHRAGTTSVLYLTSDAGEGKTSLINEVAIRQAKAYKDKRSDWLLVPIPLGGRTFLRFDDVVVSVLVNNLRFQFLYYDAFLELVRLGVLVPAFDGFEEMIVESSSGEAISALGNLVGKLRSAGTLLVAARKAYFDYPNFGSQARLFDTIGTDVDVAFERLSLKRWDRGTFTQYAGKRQVDDPDGLFRLVAEHLGNDQHPVLTRAVLVKRLVDVATEETDLSTLLDRIGQDQRDFFHDFVGGIVEREASEKWTDKSGDSSGTLLTTDEHHELLSMVAQEMWLSATDALAMDVVSLVVEMFADAREKSPAVARQIHERIKQHSLLAVTRMGRTALAFDHEDFRVFYLGQALGRAVTERDVGMLKSIIDKATLPASAVAEVASSVRRRGGDALGETLALLQSLADGVLTASFVGENCGVLTLALVDRESGPYTIKNMNFPASALRERRLTNVTVSGSYFPATGLNNTELCRCTFVNCHFERLEIDGSEKVSHTSFDDACRVNTVVRVGEDDGDHITRFDPKQIRNELIQTGFDVPFAPPAEPDADAEHDSDDDLVLVQRFLRSFLRATALNDGTVRQRLGVNANHFLGELLPRLQQAGVVKAVQYQGGGTQRRMRLLAPMSRIEEAMRASGGEFEKFVQEVQRGAV